MGRRTIIYFRYIKRAIVTKITITTTTGNTIVVMVMGLYSSIWSCFGVALQSIGAHNDRYIYSTIKEEQGRVLYKSESNSDSSEGKQRISVFYILREPQSEVLDIERDFAELIDFDSQ